MFPCSMHDKAARPAQCSNLSAQSLFSARAKEECFTARCLDSKLSAHCSRGGFYVENSITINKFYFSGCFGVDCTVLRVSTGCWVLNTKGSLTKYIHIKSYTVYAPRRNWDSRSPFLASECSPPPRNRGEGAHQPAGGGLVPIPTRDIHCGTLYVYVLCGFTASCSGPVLSVWCSARSSIFLTQYSVLKAL